MKKFLLAIVLIATTAASAYAAGNGQTAPAQQRMKNVILIIGDGMSPASETALSRYLHGVDFALTMNTFPVKTYMTTYDINTYNCFAAIEGKPLYDPATFNPSVGYSIEKSGSTPYPIDSKDRKAVFTSATECGGKTVWPLATDSAAAATAMATGQKTERGNINWQAGDKSGGKIDIIPVRLRDKYGISLGIISTVPFSHATPAGFASHNLHRDNFYTGYKGYTGPGIADEMIRDIRPDLVIAGGHPQWNNPDWSILDGYISKTLYNYLKTGGDYQFVERQQSKNGKDAITGAIDAGIKNGKKTFALFGGKDGAFEHPVATDTPGTPRVTAATIENPLFSDAIVQGVRYLSTNSNGFFLMAEQGDIDWANHANDYAWLIGSMWDLDNGVAALLDYINQPGDNLSLDNTLVLVTADHANGYLRFSPDKRLGRGMLPHQVCPGNGALCTYPNGEISFGCDDHTNELVSLYAIGAGADEFIRISDSRYPGANIIDNTDIAKVIEKIINDSH